MTALLHLRIAGVLLLVLAAAHVFFPKRFHWKEELARLSALNRQIFLVHCFFILLIVVMFAVISLVFGRLLIEPSPLARVVLAGMAIFWSLRLCFQLFVYDTRHWRGSAVNTAAHILFSMLWAYLAGVYSIILWQQVGR